MEPDLTLYCNVVMRHIDQVSKAMLTLHGRDLHNMFGMYGAELQRDIHDLVEQGYMNSALQPRLIEQVALLPGFAAKNCRRMRFVWDYFTFLYMSHKSVNIIRRQNLFEDCDATRLIYLRGADYQLAIANEGAGVGHMTLQDTKFQLSILRALRKNKNIVKALSPADLQIAMTIIGEYLADEGNTLHAVAEFARIHEAGIFMNPATWKAMLEELLPSINIALVYVSNHSRALMYELQRLVERGMQAHAILILDERRFSGRDSFFALQKKLGEDGEHVYLAINPDACLVEDKDAFEALIACFPHQIDFDEDSAVIIQAVKALIPQVQRATALPPEEIPFEFAVPLADEAQAPIAELRTFVRDGVERCLADPETTNWPAVLLYVELDIFLSLAFGDILAAAKATARYAAMADFTRDLVMRVAPPQAAELLPLLQQCGDVGANIAHAAFAMGPWDDYSNRISLARDTVTAVAESVADAMQRSLAGARSTQMRKSKPDSEGADPSAYVDAFQALLDAMNDVEETK